MAKRSTAPKRGRGHQKNPVEIPMTDLDERLEKDVDRGDAAGDVHAAGTPGGGTAYGGLAGTNIGDGDPGNANLEDAMGSGVRENEERIDDGEEDAFSGISGDMTLGALVGVGLEPDWLRALPGRLGLDNVAVRVEQVVRGEIACAKVDFDIPPQPHGRHPGGRLTPWCRGGRTAS